MEETYLAAVRIDQELCSRCMVCYSLCPFDAIERQPETGIVDVAIQKCQVCGICYSACPVTAIDMAYYDYDSLLAHIRSVNGSGNAETLVMMCRGNSPGNGEVKDILAGQGLDVDNYIPMRVPCAGRIPTDFVFNAFMSGVRNIVSIQCHDKICRMKDGTGIETRRMLLGKAVLQQLGYPEDALKVVKYSRTAVWDNKKCVGCGKCEFICPYGAIKNEPFSSPTLVAEACVGCGACQLVCPQHALHVKGFEFDSVLASYGGAAARMKAQSGKPAILVLSCQWSEYSALDNPEITFKGRNAMVLEVPCFKGMDPVHVVNAFRCGFDGVMVVVCSEKDCKLQHGRDTSERQLEVLQDHLRKMGLIDRFQMHELSPRRKGEFINRFDSFCGKIAAIPPSEVAIQWEARGKRTE